MVSPHISVEELQQLLSQRQPVTVLDIRPFTEWSEWSIPGSLHLDAYEDLKAGRASILDTAELPLGQPIVTICGAGKTSQIAAERLQRRGIDAMSLIGGMQAWSLAWNDAVLPSLSDGTQVIQLRRTGKGCLSYLISSKREAVVIDSALEPEIYNQFAAERGWRITAVLDTHIHADHLSRSQQLAEQMGATFYLPAQERVTFPFAPLEDRATIRIGSAYLTALHTPGHTPESTCFLLNGQLLFTGDTLFLNAVGRPDLEANAAEAETRAHWLYASLQRLLQLPQETVVLPGHTGMPVAFDGNPLMGTLGEVRAAIPRLAYSESEFVTELLARIPPTPPNHQQIVALNEAGNFDAINPITLEAGANRCAIV
jgi:glyoxylase-like metal-dependent hydrolase (beta-lactamase superfamily II)/rhodanese-related sulfurtransferase